METFTLYVNPRRAVVICTVIGLVWPITSGLAHVDLSPPGPASVEQAAKLDLGRPFPPGAIEHATVMLR